MNITQALHFAITKLTAKKINLPHLEAEILLSLSLKKPREFILAHSERQLTKLQTTNYKSLINKRLKGEPIAYIIGEKEFYGLKFKVNKNVLIPRPETELMVEKAASLVARNSRSATLIDIGTGSGCIIISLAKQIADPPAGRAGCQFFATDISAKALTVARHNARTHQVNKKIKFFKGDLLSLLVSDSSLKISNSKLIITANLPYGWKAWKNNTSIDSIGLKFEPEIALYTGKNGLELYEKLFKQIKELRITGYALCEIDPRQTAKIKQLIKRELPKTKFQIKKDLSGLNRLVIIEVV